MLRTKPVYRNKEDNLTLYGLPGGVVALVLGVAVCVAYSVGLLMGGFVGLALATVSYAVLAGKPPFWATYGIIYVLRRRSVLIAAAPPPEALEDALDVAREAYESGGAA